MIVMLAGGIGAAKLISGFYLGNLGGRLTVIGNTGDDLKFLGLRVCPDLDTIIYTLSGKVDPKQGWGLEGDSFSTLAALKILGAQNWFRLGDRDLATHVWRSSLLAEGVTLTEVTRRMCQVFGVECCLLPMTDAYVPTEIVTETGILHLQEYLVRDRCRPKICQIRYSEIEESIPAIGVEKAIRKASAVILCPSNPFISIGPILAVPGIRDCLRDGDAPVVAVSPIVAGTALKGPAAKMLEQLGYAVSPTSIAKLYSDFLDMFVLDERDEILRTEIEDMGIKVQVLNTVMQTTRDKVALARGILESL
jgi:LPPG:FO 2-phospho-L-lactate transferase